MLTTSIGLAVMVNLLKEPRVLFVVIMIMFNGACHAELSLPQSRSTLREIAIVGPIESAEPYFRSIHLGDEERPSKAAPPNTGGAEGNKPVPANLPLVSKLLTPGNVVPSDFRGSNLFSIPVFVVGADDRSLQWIAQRRTELQTMHAIGYVVEVQNLAAWQKIRQASGSLPLYPIPGDGLASELGLKHYPALLSNRGIQP